MTYKKAKSLLSVNYSNMTLEQLLKRKVQLLDAWRHSKAFYGFEEAVTNGFYVVVEDSGASGYTPRDIWLTHQLEHHLDMVEENINKLL